MSSTGTREVSIPASVYAVGPMAVSGIGVCWLCGGNDGPKDITGVVVNDITFGTSTDKGFIAPGQAISLTAHANPSGVFPTGWPQWSVSGGEGGATLVIPNDSQGQATLAFEDGTDVPAHYTFTARCGAYFAKSFEMYVVKVDSVTLDPDEIPAATGRTSTAAATINATTEGAASRPLTWKLEGEPTGTTICAGSPDTHTATVSAGTAGGTATVIAYDTAVGEGTSGMAELKIVKVNLSLASAVVACQGSTEARSTAITATTVPANVTLYWTVQAGSSGTTGTVTSTTTGGTFTAANNTPPGTCTVEARIRSASGPVCATAEVTAVRVVIKRDGQNITGTTSDVMVGQKINLTGEVEPGGLTIGTKQWTVPATAVKAYTQTATSGAKTDLALADLQQDAVSYNWIDGGEGREVRYTVVLGGREFQARSTFNVKRPTASLVAILTSNNPQVDVGQNGYDPALKLHFGTMDAPGISWTGEVVTPANGAGSVAGVQLTNGDRRRTLDNTESTKQKYTSGGVFVLDTDENQGVQYTTAAIGDSGTANPSSSDTPGTALYADEKKRSANDSFVLYLMYKPNGDGSIWVTLRTLTWSWSGAATKNTTTGTWSLDTGSAAPSASPSSDSTDLPQWSTNITTSQWINE